MATVFRCEGKEHALSAAPSSNRSNSNVIAPCGTLGANTKSQVSPAMYPVPSRPSAIVDPAGETYVVLGAHGLAAEISYDAEKPSSPKNSSLTNTMYASVPTTDTVADAVPHSVACSGAVVSAPL